MFLFKDLLIVGKPGKSRQNRNFRLKHWVPMADVWISENVKDVAMADISPEKAFVIGWPTVNFAAVFGWVSCLWSACGSVTLLISQHWNHFNFSSCKMMWCCCLWTSLSVTGEGVKVYNDFLSLHCSHLGYKHSWCLYISQTSVLLASPYVGKWER